MWHNNWRDKVWSEIDQDWDIIVVGGGITGAGILREATRLGLRVLLVEQRDFAWGTSSRSSKLVHGGLRYLKEGRVGLTRASVHERQQLLAEGPGLIDPLGFLLATYKGDSPGRMVYGAGLSIYDLLALQWSHRYHSTQEFRLLAGNISPEGLKGGFRYGDAQTDDARLVLRVIREAVADGATAVNYMRAEQLLRDENGQVNGLQVRDVETNNVADIHSRVVINATGAWVDHLRKQVGAEECIRPLRGSHLIFPQWRLPVAQAISFLHPIDNRPIFIFPWESITLVGTTDVDNQQSLDSEPGITANEVAYLMAAVQARYPLANITLDDIISTFSGVRPVIGSGKDDPSDESRDHAVWEENGLITVTGGKLTTFRLIALDVLREAAHLLPDMPKLDSHMPVLDVVDVELTGAESLDEKTRRRLLGRYGHDAQQLVAAAHADELAKISGTSSLWAELRWAARTEGVVHLDDLLLRRVRLGLLLREGGKAHMSQIRAICQPELGWDDNRWEIEEAAYFQLINCCYSLPARETIPDWRQMAVETEKFVSSVITPKKRPLSAPQNWLIATIMAALAFALMLLMRQRRSV